MSITPFYRKALAPFILAVALNTIGTPSAVATSTGQALALKNRICITKARFKEAVPRAGKVVWIFERLTEPNSDACRDLAKVFEVWIWSGSFSTLSKTFVYPLYITEPKPGSELSLGIEYRRVRESLSRSKVAENLIQGWFLAEGETGTGMIRK